MTWPSMLEWKISSLKPSSDAYLRMCLSYSGSFIGPNTSICALPRMFIPAPWITSTFAMSRPLPDEFSRRHDTVCGSKSLPAFPEETPMSIKRHNPGPVLCRAVEHGGLVYVAGTTADNRSASCKEQSEEILKKI